MRLSGGKCAACGTLTCGTVLWAGELRALRVWCCDHCAANLNSDVRALLLLAARRLEGRGGGPQLH